MSASLTLPEASIVAVAEDEGWMTVFPFPGFNVPRWVATAVRLLVGSVPVAIVAIFSMLILLIGLFLSESRRNYALTAVKYAGGLVKELVGPVSSASASADLSKGALGSRPDAGVLVVAEPIAGENGTALEEGDV